MVAEKSANALTLVLLLIATVTLLVSGIGIMNIMLATVTSRIREIGIRKAIGASSREIRLQFLSEAILISLVGGFVGVVIGLAIPFSVRFLHNTGFPSRLVRDCRHCGVVVGGQFCLGQCRQPVRRDSIRSRACGMSRAVFSPRWSSKHHQQAAIGADRFSGDREAARGAASKKKIGQDPQAFSRSDRGVILLRGSRFLTDLPHRPGAQGS